MMRSVMTALGPWGPVLFGFGFLALLIAQVLQRTDVALPFNLSPLMVGLIVGPLLGLAAKLRGRWI